MEQAIKAKPATYWKEQVDLAKSTRLTYEKWWEANLKAYSPQPGDDPDHYAHCINTNRDFTLVERKKSDLFYQRPDVTLTPTPLVELNPQIGIAVQAHQEIVNEHLGEDHVDAVALMDAVLFDCLNTAGMGCTVMGYESVTVDVEQPNPMDPQGLMGMPPVTVPVPIDERCFWEHFSPKQILIPHNFRSTRFDRAPWLGHVFELPLTPANRQRFKLPEDFAGKKADGSNFFDHGASQTQATEDVFTGVKIWYRSSLYREDQPHPDHLTELVIVDGIDVPVIEQDCPYQSVDPQGKLTPDSLIGFPIHIFTLRTLTDSAYIPSDSTMIRPLVNELNRFREQMVEYRDAQTLKWQYNMDVMPADAVSKMVRAPIGGMIGVPGEAFHGEGAIKELPHGSMPRESFTSNDYIDNDIARTTAIDAAGAGVQSQSSSTATEQQIVAANANARLDKERGVLLKQYLKGVTKYSTLLQRYLAPEDAAQIVGPERVGIWDAWRKTIPSALSFTAQPDSALRVDQAVDRKQFQELYTFLFNEPMVNRKALLEKLCRKFHLDPTQIVIEPPPKTPDMPKISYSIKMEDFVLPQAPFACGISEQLGIKIDPAWITTSQAMLQQSQELAMQAQESEQAGSGPAEHGGKLPAKEGLSKHAADLTGGMQNTGAPAALGAAGGMIQ